MSNVISSAVFCYRNAGKTERGEYGRLPVAVGQLKNVLSTVSKLNSDIGSDLRLMGKSLETTAETNKALKYTLKGVDFASKHINPLICVSSGVKVVSSDDKTTAAIQEVCALKGMFMGEGYMKAHMSELKDAKYVGKYVTKFLDYCKKTKGCGKIPTLLKGLGFVTGSITSYEVGHQFGKLTTNVLGTEKYHQKEVEKEKLVKEYKAQKENIKEKETPTKKIKTHE